MAYRCAPAMMSSGFACFSALSHAERAVNFPTRCGYVFQKALKLMFPFSIAVLPQLPAPSAMRLRNMVGEYNQGAFYRWPAARPVKSLV